MLRSLLTHPLARGRDLDDPQTTVIQHKIIQEKQFLKRVYQEWYRSLKASLDPAGQRILEIGSGAGFLIESIPHLITSDLMSLPWVSLVLNGMEIPFKDDALDAVVMVNVLHHVPDFRAFLLEAARCIRPGGKIVMIEPWVTAWSTIVYANFHHEPFDPAVDEWALDPAGPLSGANGALPWILFVRDRQLFQQILPMWEVSDIRLLTPLTYLLSGGVSLRSLAPGWSYPFWHRIELLLEPLERHLAMFARITLTKRTD